MNESFIHFYPELGSDRTLASFLEAKLNESLTDAARWGGAVVARGPAWAMLTKSQRSISVVTAAQERKFLVGFWDRGVKIGWLHSPDLQPPVDAALLFLVSTASISEMASRFSNFTVEPGAEFHEMGASYEVKAQWMAVIEGLQEQSPNLRHWHAR